MNPINPLSVLMLTKEQLKQLEASCDIGDARATETEQSIRANNEAAQNKINVAESLSQKQREELAAQMACDRIEVIQREGDFLRAKVEELKAGVRAAIYLLKASKPDDAVRLLERANLL